MRTLFWKEFRENWAIIFVGIIFAGFVTYIIYSNRQFVTQINDPKFILLSVLLFTSFLAANLFSTEFGHKTLPFLLTLPISRSKLWGYKALIGLFFISILIIGTIGAIFVASYLTPNPIDIKSFFDISLEDLGNYITILLLIYAGTLFVSVLVTNTVAAGGGGLMFTVFLIFFCVLFGALFYLDEFYLFHKFYLAFFLPIVILIVSSWKAFNQLDVLITRKRVVCGLRFCCLTFFIFGISLVLINSNWDPIALSQIKEIKALHLLPDNNTVICRIIKRGEKEYSNQRYWLISLNNGSYQRFPGKGYELNMRNPISQDKKFLLLTDNRGFFNLVRSRLFPMRLSLLDTRTFEIKHCSLNVSRIYSVAELLAWSPDSRKVLYRVWGLFPDRDRLAYLDIYSGENKTLKLSKPNDDSWITPYTYWAQDGKSFYTYIVDYKNKEYTCSIYRIDLNGNILWKLGPEANIKRAFITPNGKWLSFTQDSTETYKKQKVVLINLYTSDTTLIIEGMRFGSFSMSPNGKWAVIPEIISAKGQESKPSDQKKTKIGPVTIIPAPRPTESVKKTINLWLVNLETQVKNKIISDINAELNGWSPDSKKIALAVYNTQYHQYDILSSINIETKTIESSKSWMDSDKLLPDGNYLRAEGNRLVIVTPDGKQVRQVFPQLPVK